MTFARTLFTATTTLALACASLAAHADAKPEDATAMVKKGVAFIKASGKEKGYAEISNKAGQFKKEDLYLVCLLYTSPSPRDATLSRMPSSA